MIIWKLSAMIASSMGSTGAQRALWAPNVTGQTDCTGGNVPGFGGNII